MHCDRTRAAYIGYPADFRPCPYRNIIRGRIGEAAENGQPDDASVMLDWPCSDDDGDTPSDHFGGEGG
jgi:hypothetical protein